MSAAKRNLKDEVVDSVAMTQARTGATFSLLGGDSLAVIVTGSGASSPVGTSAQLSVSIDGTNWVNLGSAVALTTNTSVEIPVADCTSGIRYNYGRLVYAWGSGSINYSTRVLIKGGAM